MSSQFFFLPSSCPVKVVSLYFSTIMPLYVQALSLAVANQSGVIKKGGTPMSRCISMVIENICGIS
jgi:hypothetical protein